MKKKFDNQAYKNKFNKENYMQIGLRLPKEEGKKIKELVKEKSELSLNAFILQGLREQIKNLEKK